MRFRLILSKISASCYLPINYKYEISSWIYKVFGQGDPAFSSWLHEHGYDFRNKKFKFFTFSDLELRNFEIKGDRILLNEREIALQISFLMDNAAEKFIVGLFMGQRFGIGDKHSGVDFEVTRIEACERPVFVSTMQFRMKSPLCLTLAREDKTVAYIEPGHPQYEKRFFDNLLSKFVAYQKHAPVLAGESAGALQHGADMKLEITGPVKSRLLTIKAGTPEQTKLKVFIFPFTITAPVELIEIGYYGGFGEKNSLGLGCVEEFRI